MQAQTALQAQIAQDAAQPYVWADVRVQQINGWAMEFVLGNSGQTIATDVVVHIEPPFPSSDREEHQFVEPMHRALENGLSYLPPNREMTWAIGNSPELVNREGSLAHRVRIECVGPYGAVPANEFTIDFGGMRETVAIHTGSFRDVARAIDKAKDEVVQALKDRAR